MSIKLTPMDEETFQSYYQHLLKDYADDNVKAGVWKEEEALHKAQEQLEQLLPDGLATEEHFLLTIRHDKNPLGVLWLHIKSTDQEKQAFIYDIELDETERGKGYGKETMKALDEYAKAEGIKQIRLHVFAHNESAIGLYKKAGYEMASHHMMKRLS